MLAPRILWRALPVVLVAGCHLALSAEAPLLQQNNLEYQGAFRVPQNSPLPGATYGFDYATTGFTFNPLNNSLFINNHVYEQKTAEISIPALVNSTDINALNVAALLQNPADITEGHLSNIDSGGAATPTPIMGGLLVYNNKLIGTSYEFYDTTGAALSHFTHSLTVAQTGTFHGMFAPNGAPDAGFVDGYMAPIPTEWQTALGGTALTGNCDLSIISRTSYGPSVSVFTPDDLGVHDPFSVVTLIAYPQSHQTLGNYGSTPNANFGSADSITGVVFPPGFRSVLFFGRHGTTFCYGEGTSDPSLNGKPVPGEPGVIYCYDPDSSSKGGHGYPYEYYVWAYDVNDLIAVKNGQKNPWDIAPYSTWSFTLPFGDGGDGFQGTSYDPVTEQVYLSQAAGDTQNFASKPVIHVFKLNIAVPAITTPSPLPGATQGAAYSQTLAASGGAPPYTWSLGSGVLPQGLSLSTSGVLSGAPGAAGISNFTLQVTDSVGASTSKAFAVTVASPASPTINSPPTSSSNPIVVGQPVTFTVSATDPAGGSVSYQWNFGDGGVAGGASPTYTYLNVGSFTLTVTISTSSGGSTTLTQTINVVAGDGGSGGGGTGDGGNGGSTLPMTISKAHGTAKLNGGHDSCTFAGVLPNVAAGFTPNGQLAVNFSGATDVFTLSKSGRGTNVHGAVMLKFKLSKSKKGVRPAFLGGNVPFTINLRNGAWAADWNLTSTTSPAQQVYTVSIVLNGVKYSANIVVACSFKAKSGAKFKM